LSRQQRCRGFSLLELLVALTLFATLLGALLQIFSAGLHAARTGDRMTRAVVIAQSRLDALGVEQPLRPGVSSGATDDAYYWRITVRPYLEHQLDSASRLLRPLSVLVEVFWEDADSAHSVALNSIRLTPGIP
jgi:general secretion pathway protein I